MPQSTPEQRPQNVLTPSPGILVACPGCGKSFEPRRPNHRYCSTTCRVVWFQQKETRARRERDAMVRMKLREAQHAVNEALGLLEPENEPSR